MKKLISILLAAILVFSFAVPVFVVTAAETTSEVSDVEMSSSEKAVRSIWALFSKWGPQIKKIMKTIIDFISSLFGPGDPEGPTTEVPTTEEPVTEEPTTKEPTTKEPTTKEPTTKEPTTQEPTTKEPTTKEPTTVEPTTQEPTTQEPTTEEPTTQEPTTEPEKEIPMSKSEFVSFFNEQTSEIKTETYTIRRQSGYKDGKMPDIETPAIVKYDTVENVIRSFLGIGVREAVVHGVAPAGIKDAYLLKNAQIYESDITYFDVDNGVYTFGIKDSTNPDTNTTPFSRFTNDFITKKQVSDEVSSQTSGVATLKDFSVSYTDIECKVTVKNGKIVNIEYSYISEFNIVYRALLKNYDAKGSVSTTVTCESIVY